MYDLNSNDISDIINSINNTTSSINSSVSYTTNETISNSSEITEIEVNTTTTESVDTESTVNEIVNSSIQDDFDEPTTVGLSDDFPETTDNDINELSVDESVTRFSSAPWFNVIVNKYIAIGGQGGIGSWCSLLIARLKPTRLTIFDPDRVERVNLAGQLYSEESVGNYKCNAVYTIMQKFALGCNMYTYNHAFEGNHPIIICGYDNMNARKDTFDLWLHTMQYYDKRDCLFIDGRLLAETFQIFCIRGDDSYNIHNYKKNYLFEDEDAETPACSYKQTSYMASMIASYITNLLVNFCSKEADENSRVLPFFIEYEAFSMNLTVKMQ